MGISICNSSYNLSETLHSGQAFRWNKTPSTLETESHFHEGVINGMRVRLVQSNNRIESAFPQSTKPLDLRLALGFAGVEVLRRLWGIAKLPLPDNQIDRESVWIEWAIALVLDG